MCMQYAISGRTCAEKALLVHLCLCKMILISTISPKCKGALKCSANGISVKKVTCLASLALVIYSLDTILGKSTLRRYNSDIYRFVCSSLIISGDPMRSRISAIFSHSDSPCRMAH